MKPAVVIWGALMMSVLTFTCVVAFIGPLGSLPELAVYVMLGVAMVNVVLSRVIPRVAPNEQTRHIVGFAIAESAALISGVTYLVSGNRLALAGIGVGFFALATLFPREKTDGETVRLIPPR